jgi:hypothetical protein
METTKTAHAVRITEFGQQILNALHFVLNGFPQDQVYDDTIIGGNVLGRDMFEERDGRWFMRQQSLPGNLAIKAIAVDATEGLLLEVTPFSNDLEVKIIREYALPFKIKKVGRGRKAQTRIIDTTTKELIMFVDTAEHFYAGANKNELPEELGPRWLVTVPLAKLNTARQMLIVRFLDAVYDNDCFSSEGTVTEDVSEVRSVQQAATMSLRLDLRLMQMLELEQRPILSLRNKLVGEQVLNQHMELAHLQQLERKILHMTEDELTAFAAQLAAEKGTQTALKVLMFTLARTVREAQPGISWKEARKIVRQLVSKPIRKIGTGS